MKAFVYRSGQVKVGETVPDGAIEIAEGDDAALRTVILAVVRFAHDGETLVPGIPEAEDEDAALDALFAFQADVMGRMKQAALAAMGSRS